MLHRLPERQRAVVVLRYYEDLPEREIAGLLRTSVAAVKSLLMRALDHLRGDMEREDW
ncbi:MAG TPA: sigma factor-like helix-turn-helix DNA-binding protein [Actinomycetota bacterium]|jgi:RNA polymerase sigma factor (sigma-70 family)